MEVHRQLGHGFLEAVYQEAAIIEFSARNIPFEKEPGIPIYYKDTLLAIKYRADFVCFSDVIVEFKAIANLTSADEAQLINYLKATSIRRGLIVNFGAPSLQYKRLVFGFDKEKSA